MIDFSAVDAQSLHVLKWTYSTHMKDFDCKIFSSWKFWERVLCSQAIDNDYAIYLQTLFNKSVRKWNAYYQQ